MDFKRVVNYRPIALCAIALSIGIVLGGLALKASIAYFLLLAFLVIAVVTTTLLKRRVLVLVALFATFGFLSFSITYFIRSEEPVYYESAYLEGRIEQVAQTTEARKRYVLEDVILNGDAVAVVTFFSARIPLYSSYVIYVPSNILMSGIVISFNLFKLLN